MYNRRRVSLTLALALSLTAAGSAAAQQQEGFGEAIDVNVVNVDVYVTDKNGRPVTGLRKEDFELREDGKRVEITNFEALAGTLSPEPVAQPAIAGAPTPEAATPASSLAPAPEPLHLVVYVDNVNIRPANRARALQQIREFLDREVRPGDRVMVVTYDMGLHIRQPFTDDRAALARALDEVMRSAARGGEMDRARKMALEAMFSIREEEMAGPQGPGAASARASARGGGEVDDEGEEPGRRLLRAHRRADQELRRSRPAGCAEHRSSLKLFVNSLSGLPGRKVLLHVSDGISVTPGEELFQASRSSAAAAARPPATWAPPPIPRPCRSTRGGLSPTSRARPRWTPSATPRPASGPSSRRTPTPTA